MSESVLCADFMTQRVSKFYTHNIENEKKKKNVGQKNQGIKAEYANRLRLWWAGEEQNATAADESHEV